MSRRAAYELLFALAVSLGLGLVLWNTLGQGGELFRVGEGELATRFELLNPRWITVFAVAPLFVWGMRRSLADLPRAQRWLGVLLRALLTLTLAFAVARLSKTSDATRVSTVFLVDVSASMSDEAIEAAREQVRAAWEARGENHVELVTFAEQARTISLPADDEEEFPTIERHSAIEAHATIREPAGEGSSGEGADTGVAPSDAELPANEGEDLTMQSDLRGALQLAYGLFAPGHLRRAVLLSDGLQTRGDVLAEASRARRFGVRVHVYPSRHEVPPEVAIRGLELPARIAVGDPFHVRVRLFASRPTEARLRVYQGETLNGLGGIRDLELPAGETEIEIDSVVRIAGPVTYRATLEPRGDDPADRFAANNRFETSALVPGKPRVLYVEGAQGRATYLARALGAGDFDVDVRAPSGIPTSARELEGYDFFVLSDVAADQVSFGQQQAIESYVRDSGGGFLMAGGERGFGLGGWQGTRLERILPVRMDAERRRDQPTLALALVIDRSGSMNGTKIELAKEAAKATAELLGPDDHIGVIGFDAQPERVVRMQSARNRLRILRDIGRLRANGGTAIFPALDMAYEDLSVTRARIKHVILLTDGQAPEQGITELVQVMRAEGITVSTVGLGADVNRALLQSVARLGGGRSYLTNDPHRVPRIFMRETTTVSRSAAVEDYFQPHVVQRADFLRGVPIDSAPFLHGYVATRAKAAPAQVILQSDLGEPLLARWRVGLGWSMAWTSDVKNRWAVEWVRWGGFSRFWNQLVREHMRQRRREQLDMRAEIVGDEVQVVVDAVDANDHFMNDLSSELRIEGPMGARRAREDDPRDAANPQLRRTETLPLHQVAPGRYEARLPLDAYCSFVLSAAHRREGRLVAESTAQLAYPYPRELREVEPDEALLAQVAELTGGSVDPAPTDVFDAHEETIEAHEELWPKLLYLALFLFVIDLLLRRVRLFDRGFETSAR